jgi:hypothetical protein
LVTPQAPRRAELTRGIHDLFTPFARTLPDVIAGFLTGGWREEQRNGGTRDRSGHKREQHRAAPDTVVFCHRNRSKRC